MTTSPVMKWLAAGVPLTLLCDLAPVGGPGSRDICAVERPAGDPIHAEVAKAPSAGARAVG